MKQTILKRSCHVIIEFLVHVAPEPSCSETRFLPAWETYSKLLPIGSHHYFRDMAIEEISSPVWSLRWWRMECVDSDSGYECSPPAWLAGALVADIWYSRPRKIEDHLRDCTRAVDGRFSIECLIVFVRE